MAYRNSQQHHNYMNSYNKEKYDRITVLVPSGNKNKITEIVKNSGFKSVNEFLLSAIDEKLASMGVTLE